jgi:uncharacterized protein (UPF0297 family)
MAAQYVETLQKKREEVLAEVRSLRSEMSDMAARVASKENQLKNIEDLLSLEGEGIEEVGGGAQESPHAGSRFIDHAYRLLAEAGKPVHYRELARLLTRDGAYIPGQDAAANLLAHMSRDERFGRTRSRGVYGLADWPAVRAATKGTRQARRTPKATRGRRR